METIVSNREKLLQMYNYAISNGICSNRKTFAGVIGIGDKNLSNALSNNEKTADRFCTNGLLNKANAALGYVFSQQWIQDGTGDMYAQAQATAGNTDTTPLPSAPVTEDSSDVDYRMRCTELERVIEALKGTIESQKGTIKSQERIIEMLENENESLKKARTHVS
jgi:predicted RNase H-like nuclease (RuvC/YqgF family)